MVVAVKTLSALQVLVTENAAAIAPGFRVMAAGVRVGRSSIDLVGLDSLDRPALIALDVTGDPTLPFRMAEAYAAALEDPDSIRRLVQGARGCVGWPPRAIFIAERLSEAFWLRLKLLALPAVDCFEYRCVEVHGQTSLSLDRVECGARPAGVPTSAAVEEPTPAETLEPSQPSVWDALLAALNMTPEVESHAAAAPPARTPAAPPNGRLTEKLPAAVEPPGSEDVKIATIREYLQREFPLLMIYDFSDPERNARVFQLQDTQGMVPHLAVVTSEFFSACRCAELPATLERMRLAEAMRHAGSAGVRVTPTGVDRTR